MYIVLGQIKYTLDSAISAENLDEMSLLVLYVYQKFISKLEMLPDVV